MLPLVFPNLQRTFCFEIIYIQYGKVSDKRSQLIDKDVLNTKYLFSFLVQCVSKKSEPTFTCEISELNDCSHGNDYV